MYSCGYLLYGRYSPLYDTFYGDKMLTPEHFLQKHTEALLASLQSTQQDLDWATELLKTHAVYRCRNDLTLLDRCAETQWITAFNNRKEFLMQRLAENYPDFTADWLRC